MLFCYVRLYQTPLSVQTGRSYRLLLCRWPNNLAALHAHEASKTIMYQAFS